MAVQRKTGRPTKLTPELQTAICDLIRNGNYFEHACQAVGITAATFCDWRAKAESQPDSRYSEFLDATKQAEAEAVTSSVAHIRKAGADFWTADAWFLERKYPEHYGRRERIEQHISGTIVHTADPRLASYSLEELDAIAERLRLEEQQKQLPEAKVTVLEADTE